MNKPSVLIATPAYGGQFTSQYMLSIVPTLSWLEHSGYTYQFYNISNESLIPRARNQCAWFSIANGPDGQPFDKLLFIDSDMGWKHEDVKMLLESDKRVVGGAYPGKRYPIEIMANALLKDRGLFGAKRSVEELHALRDAKANTRGEVEMHHIPTGFMCIDTKVLIDLMPHVEHYRGVEHKTQQQVLMWDFFPIGVAPVPGEPLGEYESEDWAFCSLVRKHLDCGVWLNSHVITTHTGTHVFKAGHVG